MVKRRDRYFVSQNDHAPALPIPSTLRERLEGYRLSPDTVGESDADVYKLDGAQGRPDLFLKHAQGEAADDLTGEMARLRWLRGYLPVPEIVCFIRDADDTWLLTTALEGSSADEVLRSEPARREEVIDALACFMLRFHAIPADECPFNSQFAFRLHKARRRIDAGLVDTDDFDDEREGWTAEQVWTAIRGYPIPDPEPVVTHGDFSLDNILISGGEVSGCIDVGRLGVADPYQDLAILWNCLRDFGPELQERLFQRYGLPHIDETRLHLHRLLDELF